MKMILIVAVLSAALVICGCGGGSDDTPSNTTAGQVEFTPQGTAGFIPVGTTGIFVSTLAGVVNAPLTVRFTRFVTQTGLPPIPQGFSFLGAVTVDASQPVGFRFNSPVTLRIPLNKSFAAGTLVPVFGLQNINGQNVFIRLTDTQGNPVSGVVTADGLLEFQVDQPATYLAAEATT